MSKQAFSYPKRQQLWAAIRVLKERVMLHERHGLTHNDLLCLLAKPKDREALARVAQITAAATQTQFTSARYIYRGEQPVKVIINFSVPASEENRFLVPYYGPSNSIQRNLPEDTEAKLHAIVGRAIDVWRKWELVKDVFDAIINRCDTASQVKFFMPTVVTLLRVPYYDEDVNAYADKIYSMSTPGSIPAIPLELRRAAVDVGTTITQAFMMSEKSEEPSDAFSITIQNEEKIIRPWQ